MPRILIVLAVLLIGGTVAAAVLTVTRAGVSRADEPQGISLREESARTAGRGFFFGYHSRSHRGGGLRGGK